MPPKKAKNAELVDWYKKIPEKYLLKSHNPHFETHHIKVPFRMIIAGNSGSGKTQTLLNLLYNMPNTFENMYITTKNKDEPLYNYLEDKLGKKGLKITEGLANLPDLDGFDKEQQSLIILDDLVNEPLKQQKQICDYYIRARKKNCSLIYISQSFYGVPKLIRDNINYLILKQVSSMKNLTMIAREYSLGIDKKALKDIYDAATEKKQDFLLIDLEGEKTERFRKNFDEVFEVADMF
jgi:ABC-type dipeptide/oligopeptide/nickel transport system ATPase component